MKKYSGKNRSARYLVALALAISTLTATPAHAAIVSFNCPTGGGTYQVNNGSLTGTTGTCSGDLTLDSSVTTISTYGLGSSQLTSLTIPATVTTISGSPFGGYGSFSLVSITVDANNPNFSSIDGVLFNKLQTELIAYPGNKAGTTYAIPSSVTSVRYYGFANSNYLVSMNIPNTVTTLGGQIFLGSKVLTTVNIGTGLVGLGDQAFAWLPTLTSINVDAANATYASINGVLYNKNISRLWSYPGGKAGTSYTAPNTVTSTATTAFGGVVNLQTVDLSSVSTLSSQTFMDAPSIVEVTFGNSLTALPSQTFQSAPKLRKINFGTGLTSITSGAFYANTRLYCIIYTGSNSTIQNYSYPNGIAPVTNSANCLANPAFRITDTRILGTVETVISGYSIISTGGAIASYSISPSISNIPGLTFDTSTGLISGTPLYTTSAQTFTITANNAADTAVQTFTLIIRPIPIPFFQSITKPQLRLKDGKYVCSAGTYQFGYTRDGEIDRDMTERVIPTKYTYNLLINDEAQASSQATSASTSNSWSIAQPASGSLVSCSVSVTLNSYSTSDKSTEIMDGVGEARMAQAKAIKAAEATYTTTVKAIAPKYQKALVDLRASWRKQIDAIRANYYLTLDRLKTSGGSKMVADSVTAAEIMAAAKTKANDDYEASKNAAYDAVNNGKTAATVVKATAIAKAKATYGTYIESIGHGVLIP
jgi:hypothetical protein